MNKVICRECVNFRAPSLYMPTSISLIAEMLCRAKVKKVFSPTNGYYYESNNPYKLNEKGDCKFFKKKKFLGLF